MDELRGENRILISAADSGHEAYTEYAYRIDTLFQHFAFLYQRKGCWWQTHDGFILALGNIINSRSIKNAYDNGVEAVNINIQDTPSNSQIDDNLNGFSAEDGVYDGDEYDHGTNPQDEDTDNDGLTDYEEIYTYHTYAYTWDSDGDELSDYKEITEGTNPMRYTYKWLVMLYLDGDNNLYPLAFEEKENMLSNYNKLGYSVKVTMIFDGDGSGDSEYYEISKDGYSTDELGEVDMGSYLTLNELIMRSYNFYRDAEKIILVIFNHGYATLGMCRDDHSNGDMLSIDELKISLEYANNLFNKNMDILYFQACTMQQIEIDYALQDYVKNIIGSQWLLGGSSFSTFPYRIIINEISRVPESSDIQIAREIVDGEISNSGDYVISSVRTNYIIEMARLINEISEILIDNWTIVHNDILKVVNNPWFSNGHATGYPYRDLRHFFLWVEENLTTSGYSDSALYRYINSLLQYFSESVYVNFNDYERSHLWFQGVGIFLPLNSEENSEEFLSEFENIGAPKWYKLTQIILGELG